MASEERTTPVADGRHWRGDYYRNGICFRAALWESANHPGYYHYALHRGRENAYTASRMPIKADAVRHALRRLMAEERAPPFDEFDWKEVAAKDIPFDTTEVIQC